MKALPRRIIKPASPTKETYIGIWNYFHGLRQSRSLCIHTRTYATSNAPTWHRHVRTFCRSCCSSEKSIRLPGEAAPSNESIPITPNESDQDGVKRLDETPAAAVEESSNLEELPGEAYQGGQIQLPREVLKKLRAYEQHRALVQRTTVKRSDWYTLREIARGDALDNGQLSVEIELGGFITSQRGNKSKGITFYQLVDPQLRLTLQLIATDPNVKRAAEEIETTASSGGDAPTTVSNVDSVSQPTTSLDRLNLKPHTPVRVTGRLSCRPTDKSSSEMYIAPHWLQGINYGKYKEFGKYDGVLKRLDPYVGEVYSLCQIEMHVNNIIPLNSFPDNIVAKSETNFPPEQRHLQLRTKADIRSALRTRSLVMASSRKFLFKQGFDEVETPLLFKSTPEGAREFVVPTRKPGMAYALPQSPQQYKQLLMASGISRYFQFAKCFRDEDMRTDRQPEFTQLDLEMSFADRGDVMSIIEYLVAGCLWPTVRHYSPFEGKLEYPHPFYKWIPPGTRNLFPVLTYQDAMSRYGSDKPDLRFAAQFKRIEEMVPSHFKAMLTSLEDPILEMVKIPTSHGNQGNPKGSRKFIGEFLDAPSCSSFMTNAAGAPGIAVYDPSKPLNGLAAFGHDAAARIEDMIRPLPADILIVQARPRANFFTGGSTPLGNLRRDVFEAAVAQGLLAKPATDRFVWITDFPLFSPVEESEPGQGGAAGICSTHHPFTAPRAGQDLSKLYSDPLSLIGDHYDLVINGVEVGGGSVRIHDTDIQELIFKDVLKMTPGRVEDFRHLLDALKAGCPPHAGFALGFDRLLTVMLGKESIKDVIAFPKTAAGEDKMVGSPGMLTPGQLDTYHLAVNVQEKKEAGTEPTLSLKA